MHCFLEKRELFPCAPQVLIHDCAPHCPTLIDIALFDKLRTTTRAILVSVPPALRMIFFAAFRDNNIRVYHIATLRAVTDRGGHAAVIQVWT